MMNKGFLFLIGFLLLNSCNNKTSLKENIVFSGKIKNGTTDTLYILDAFDDPISKILINDKHQFNDTLDIPSDYYYIEYEDSYFGIYLQPGFNLNLNFDVTNLESTSFQGKGASENNYLLEKQFKEDSLGHKIYPPYYSNLNETDFYKFK